MDLKITKKTEEPLLSRIKIESDVNFDSATPSKKDIQTKVASLQKVTDNLIVVKNITSSFGQKTAKTVCYQYEDEKKLKLIEPKEKAKKEKKEGAEKKEAPKKEEPKKKEDKPAKKEESKKEKPKEEPKKEEKPKK